MGYCFLISLGSGSFSILGFFWPIGDFAYHSVYLELIIAGFEEERERESNRGNFTVFSFCDEPIWSWFDGVGILREFFFSLAV